MKTLKFTARFFNYNKLHDQFEYIVQCTGFNGAYSTPKMTPFTIGVSRDFERFGKISDSLDSSSSVEYVVSSITDEKGRKAFESAFWQAIKDGFENVDRSGFNFEISQSMTDASSFTFQKTTSPFNRYTKTVNGSPYIKKFSTDLGAVVADAKFCWFNNLDLNEDLEEATQLNVDQLWDEEEEQTFFAIEFEREGHWYDATTWESGDDAKAYFTPNYPTYSKLIDSLKSDIAMLFDPQWESVYTLDDEILNRQDYEDRLSDNK